LIGAKPGETREFTLTPDRAYGERDEEAFQTVKRSVFGEGAELEVGLSSYTQLQDGSMTMFTITAIDGDDVTLDFNHVMAGKTLTFTVTVTDVSEVDNCGPGCGCN
jgi:FKBP-type peptidyl-prolyl cis-trans isomerase SlyD